MINVSDNRRLEMKQKNGLKSKVLSIKGILSGIPVVEGTRVPAETVIAELLSGSTRAEIFRHYPTLPLDGIEACIEWDKSGRPINE